MDDIELLIDLHLDGQRQGPGSDDATREAIALCGLDTQRGLAIADIGCGTGASTLVLAEQLHAHITAVDFVPEFLARLDRNAQQRGLAERITTQIASMDELAFEPESLDAIWCEGAIYNIGFANGIRAWRHLLKPGGVLAVSELTWLTPTRPAEIQQHWTAEYTEIDTASHKIALLERAGYSPVGYFVLPDTCWTLNYYQPLQQRFAAFLQRHNHSNAAKHIVEAEQQEIDLHQRFSAYVGYSFYIAKRTHAAIP